MAALFPFRALRPAPEAAARVASVPYDVVSTAEARALAAGNPLSFLRVTRPEIDLPPETDPHDDQVYAQAVRNLEDLKRAAPLVLEQEPALYVYRMRMGSHEQTGIAGCFSLDEYDRGLIKKHERTRKDKEDDRTRHMIELRAQTGVVFLTYVAMTSIDRLTAQVTAESPLYDFTAADGVAHTIWRVAAAQAPQFIEAFSRLPALYIADGHHRAASAARARDVLDPPRSLEPRTLSLEPRALSLEPRALSLEPRALSLEPRTLSLEPRTLSLEPRTFRSGGATEASRFVAVAFPDTQVQILPYNRVVADLAGLTADGLLEALRGRMRVTEATDGTARKGEVRMFLAGRWHAVALPKPPAGASRDEALDVAILERDVLRVVLGIGDIRTDKRIDFIGGARGTAELERRVAAGEAAVAFALHPVDIDDLMAIADAGGIMPPKSTWFEPKLRDGLLIHLM